MSCHETRTQLERYALHEDSWTRAGAFHTHGIRCSLCHHWSKRGEWGQIKGVWIFPSRSGKENHRSSRPFSPQLLSDSHLFIPVDKASLNRMLSCLSPSRQEICSTCSKENIHTPSVWCPLSTSRRFHRATVSNYFTKSCQCSSHGSVQHMLPAAYAHFENGLNCRTTSAVAVLLVDKPFGTSPGQQRPGISLFLPTDLHLI